MSKRKGSRRKHSPHIPTHIDQNKIPNGVYYDHRGRGRWYMLSRDEAGNQRRQNIADAKATLSELHRIIEQQHGIDRDTLRYLASEFHKSAQFLKLSSSSKDDYEYCRNALMELPTKLGKPLGDLPTRKFRPALVQRIIDKTAAEGTPSKANHMLRYLRRLFRWGINRGYCDSNPATGVEAATERKRHRLPQAPIAEKLVAHAQAVGNDYPVRGKKGSCPTYLWIVMEIAYLCRLRGIEVVTLTDANDHPEGLLTNRRKGSRDNIVRWTPRLRAAWQAAVDRRRMIWEKKGRAVPMLPERRPLIVSRSGEPLRKNAFDSAWQRFIHNAFDAGVITEEERFSLHDLKRKGITDTKGNRHDKQEASGHRSENMMDVYDLSIPIVKTSDE